MTESDSPQLSTHVKEYMDTYSLMGSVSGFHLDKSQNQRGHWPKKEQDFKRLNSDYSISTKPLTNSTSRRRWLDSEKLCADDIMWLKLFKPFKQPDWRASTSLDHL